MVGTTMDTPLAVNVCPHVSLSIPLTFHDITDLPSSLSTIETEILEVAKAWNEAILLICIN